MAFDISRVEVLTFDCYGTLIDWEAGLWQNLGPLFRRYGVDVASERALELFADLESEIERGEYRPYRDVLGAVLIGLGERLRFTPSASDVARFSGSVADWPAFADSAGALAALKTRFRLAIVSNVDDDLFAHSARRLDVPFDWVITAQQARAYKPSPTVFRTALGIIGVTPERILHVAQSLYHDVAPARTLGLATVWVNRRHGRSGFGATPPSDACPDFEVPDLSSLAQVLIGRVVG
jgi:2-haloacid dehalogenase